MRASRFAFVALAIASQAAAQQPVEGARPGIGVAFNPGGLTIPGEPEFVLPQTGFNNLLFPIRTPTVTIEPELGITRSSVENRASGGPTFTNVQTVSHYRLGIGFLKHFTRREGLEPYVGPRLGLIRSSAKEESSSGTTTNTTSSKATNWYLGGAAGAQYFFSSHLTLGGEAQVRYTGLGSPDIEGPASSFDRSGNILETIGLITLRWYF